MRCPGRHPRRARQRPARRRALKAGEQAVAVVGDQQVVQPVAVEVGRQAGHGPQAARGHDTAGAAAASGEEGQVVGAGVDRHQVEAGPAVEVADEQRTGLRPVAKVRGRGRRRSRRRRRAAADASDPLLVTSRSGAVAVAGRVVPARRRPAPGRRPAGRDLIVQAAPRPWPSRTETSLEPSLATTRSGVAVAVEVGDGEAGRVGAGEEAVPAVDRRAELAVAQAGVDQDVVAAAVGDDQVGDAVAVQVGQRPRRPGRAAPGAVLPTTGSAGPKLSTTVTRSSPGWRRRSRRGRRRRGRPRPGRPGLVGLR